MYDPTTGIPVVATDNFIELKCIASVPGLLESQVVTKTYKVERQRFRGLDIGVGAGVGEVVRPNFLEVMGEDDIFA